MNAGIPDARPEAKAARPSSEAALHAPSYDSNTAKKLPNGRMFFRLVDLKNIRQNTAGLVGFPALGPGDLERRRQA